MTTEKRSGFEGFLWVIPLATFVGTIWTGVLAWKASHSGSTIQLPDGTTVESDVNVSWFATGYGWWCIGLLIITLLIIWLMRRER